MSNAPASERFHPLPPEAIDHLNRQRAYVAQLVREHIPGAQLCGERSDLPIVQKVIDGHLVEPNQTWELQALGVAFGDALATMVDGLAWCEVSDNYGTDPTLRYRDTSFQVNALTMISKRIESGKPVDLERLASGTAATLAEFLAP